LQLSAYSQDIVNSTGLPHKVGVKCANNDTRMLGSGVVQSNKMFAIQREHRSIVCAGKHKHCVVGHLQVSHTSLLYGQDIVAYAAKLLDNWQWKILICKEASHELSSLVLADLFFDFVSVRTHVRPRIRKIVRSQRRVDSKQLSLASPQPARLLQHPHRDSRANNTRLTSADVWSRFNPRKCVAQIAND